MPETPEYGIKDTTTGKWIKSYNFTYHTIIAMTSNVSEILLFTQTQVTTELAYLNNSTPNRFVGSHPPSPKTARAATAELWAALKENQAAGLALLAFTIFLLGNINYDLWKTILGQDGVHKRLYFIPLALCLCIITIAAKKWFKPQWLTNQSKPYAQIYSLLDFFTILSGGMVFHYSFDDAIKVTIVDYLSLVVAIFFAYFRYKKLMK